MPLPELAEVLVSLLELHEQTFDGGHVRELRGREFARLYLDRRAIRDLHRLKTPE